MAAYTLPYFGNLPTDNLEEYYAVNIAFNGAEIQIDLNFEEKTIDLTTMDNAKKLLETIGEFDAQNQKYLRDDYHDEEGDTVKLYLEHHLAEVGKEELSTLIHFDDKTTEPEKQLLAHLKLVRVGLYLHSEESFAIFDYSIGEDITNYLVVIKTDMDGTLDYMVMES